MARDLDDQSIPEENRWFVAPPAFYEALFQAGAKFAEVQVTGDATSPLRNGLIMQGNIAGFNCYKSTALNGNSGTDVVTITGQDTTNDFVILAGHMSSTATASHIAKTEVVRSTETFSDIVRGLHVFGRKVLASRSSRTGCCSDRRIIRRLNNGYISIITGARWEDSPSHGKPQISRKSLSTFRQLTNAASDSIEV